MVDNTKYNPSYSTSSENPPYQLPLQDHSHTWRLSFWTSKNPPNKDTNTHWASSKYTHSPLFSLCMCTIHLTYLSPYRGFFFIQKESLQVWTHSSSRYYHYYLWQENVEIMTLIITYYSFLPSMSLFPFTVYISFFFFIIHSYI